MSSNDQDFSRPRGSRMRRPEAMARGTEYKLLAVAKEKSKFLDKHTGNTVFKTLAIYKDFGMTFYTFMPFHYDNKDDDYYIAKNKDIQDGKNVRVVFYGKIAGTNELEILDDGQEVDKTKLEGVKTIMDLEAGHEPSPKKFKTESIDD